MLDYVFKYGDVFCVMLISTKQLIELDSTKSRLSDIVYKTGESINIKDFDSNFYKAQDAINILRLDNKIENIING